jgi:hypothetical protein
MAAWNRIAYRLYVVLGIVAVVAATVLTALANADDPGSRTPLYVGVGAVGAYLAGLLVFQWAILRDQGWVGGSPDAARDVLPDGRDALIDALAVTPPDRDGRRRAAAGIGTGITRHMTMLTLLVAAIMGGAAAYLALGAEAAISPLGADGPAIPLVFLPAIALIVAWAAAVPATVRWARRAQDAWLAPLGLHTAGTPGSIVLPGPHGGLDHRVVGATTLAGVRHGRAVEVRMTGRVSTVRVAAPAPLFRGSSHEGRLRLDEPDAGGRLAALVAATADDRWRRVTFAGGPGGIVVERRTSQPEALEARWLEDLWLAERLADAVSGAPPGPPEGPTSVQMH